MKKLIYNNKILRRLLSPFIKFKQQLFNKNYKKEKTIIKNISDLLIADPIIKVEEFQGIFNLDIKSDLFFRLVLDKKYEPELVKICLKYIDKNKDIIDIGANIGFFSVLFGKNIKNGKVLSIEPTKNALSRLYKNIELNNVRDNIDVFEGVVSNQKGTVEIKTIKGKEEYSSLGIINHPSAADEKWLIEEVKAITLDELILKKQLKPGFIKIDVEGAEHLVFEGAKEILANHRPIILSELSDFLLKKNGSSSEEVIDLIRSFNYDVYDPINPKINPGVKDFGDIICFPKEMNIFLDN